MNIQIISSSPTINESMEINLAFLDKNNRLLTKVNYGVEIKQQEQTILLHNSLYSEKGLSTMNTRPLNSNEPVTIAISINGIGIPDDEKSWTEPKGEVIIFTVVPEFGEIAIIILSTTIAGVLFMNFKYRSLLIKQNSL
jgi:hypothetical protein